MTVRLLVGLLTLVCALVVPATAQVPTPESHFGFRPGTDRMLADWDELTAYYDRLAHTSPRVTIDTLGPTTQGRPFVMMTITSEANHARLDELHEIQMKLSDPRRVAGDSELERLIEEGRTVVMITQHIHSTEVGSGQMAPLLAYELATSNDPKVREILDNVVLLHVPSLNPDGTHMVTEWYNEWVGTEYEAAPVPFLYHPYIGHDNNRDWYAFTQLETQMAINDGHNAWHPHIVHDVHQMGSTGARFFVPPFVDPWEPNIDPLLTTAVNQLGMYIAAELTSQGKTGVVVNAIFDAYTPARAYQHYHGGARILSETASARMASPITIAPDELQGGRGYDASQPSWNFPAPWKGGEWTLPDIVEHQKAGAMALLSNAARHRRYWLENFWAINQRAVDGWDEWPTAWVIPAEDEQENDVGLRAVLRILRMGDVEVHRAEQPLTAGGRSFAAGSYVVPMNQPYASFAQTLLEVQDYPDLRQYPGGPPQRPYDATAQTLPLLMETRAYAVDEPVRVALSDPIEIPDPGSSYLSGTNAPRIAFYKSWNEPMDAGWTRWVLDQHAIAYDTLHDADIHAGALDDYDVILFQNQAPRAIRDGFSSDQMPPGYAGGLGEAGAQAVRSFVEQGGRMVAIEQATDYAIDLFGLDVTNQIEDMSPDDFYIPGSILRLDVDEAVAQAAGVDPTTIAWYWSSSRAFEVADSRARVVARYGEGEPRLSGWVLGSQRIAGAPAMVEADVGRGSVVLFGFQPNYRAQTIATWPLLFNALRGGGGARVSLGSR